MMPPSTVPPRMIQFRKDGENGLFFQKRASRPLFARKAGRRRFNQAKKDPVVQLPSKTQHGRKLFPEVITVQKDIQPKHVRKSLFPPRKSRRKIARIDVQDNAIVTTSNIPLRGRSNTWDESSCSSLDSKSFMSVPSEAFDDFAEESDATAPLSTSSTSSTPSSDALSKSVSFGSVGVRQYARCIGDNPSASPNGPSMSIDWDYEDMGSITADEFEQLRHSKPPRTSKRLEPLSGMDRAILIGLHTDCSKADLDQSVEALIAASEERRESKLRFHLESIEEARRKKLGSSPDDKPVLEMTNTELLLGLNSVVQKMKAEKSKAEEQNEDDSSEADEDEEMEEEDEETYSIASEEEEDSLTEEDSIDEDESVDTDLKETSSIASEEKPTQSYSSKPARTHNHARWD